jgi:hypothetical protein
MGRYGQDYRGLRMGPGWGWEDRSDPNWRGGTYHGYRMQPAPHRAAYGDHRLHHQYDLGGHGGFDGRYDWPDGRFDREGIYHEAYEQGGGMRSAQRVRYDVDYEPRWERSGGVRYDSGYLRQYNAHSPALGPGGPERSWGFAEGPGAPPLRGHDARGRATEERRYAGYNTGGFAEGKFRGPGTRGAAPNR